MVKTTIEIPTLVWSDFHIKLLMQFHKTGRASYVIQKLIEGYVDGKYKVK